MRVIFLGTPEFAVPSLQILINSSYQVSAVFTQPDRPSGRGQKLQPPPVKTLAEVHGIPVYQPEKIRDEGLRAPIKALQPDFIVVVAYGQILPGWLLSAARIAPVNVHGSLLPRYRGAAPVIWAILNGESVTGITTMLMDAHLDTGPILLRREFSIPENMSAGELADQLARLGADMLIPTLDGLRDGTLRPVEQDHVQATWAPRVAKAMAEIRWSSTAREIHNKIRAFFPRPLAFVQCEGQRVQFLRSRIADVRTPGGYPPGTFLGMTESGILIQCGDHSVLEILDLQPANRRPVSGREFANGIRLSAGMMAFPNVNIP